MFLQITILGKSKEKVSKNLDTIPLEIVSIDANTIYYVTQNYNRNNNDTLSGTKDCANTFYESKVFCINSFKEKYFKFNGFTKILTEEKFLTYHQNNSTIKLMNTEFQVLSEVKIENRLMYIETINKNIIATIQSSDFDIDLFVIDRGNLQYLKSLKNTHCTKITALKKLRDNKLASFSINEIKIWDTDGNLLAIIERGCPNPSCLKIDVLSDSLLLIANNMNIIEIWNYETGALVQKISECSYIGNSQYGFFARKEDNADICHLDFLNNEGIYEGVVSLMFYIDNEIKHPIHKIQHIQKNSYILVHSVDRKYQLKLVEIDING